MSRRSITVLALVALVTHVAAAAAAPPFRAEAKRSRRPCAPAADATARAMRAHIDPATGRLTVPPPAAAIAVPRSSAGLVEEPAPGGGVMIHLQGRFAAPLVAHAEADGGVGVRHGSPDAR